MASTFPLAPTNGDIHYVSGTSYTYNATVGWVRTPSPVTTLPADGANFTNSLAQFTAPIFGQTQVFENIFDAYINNTGILQQGAAGGWDVTTYASNTWGGLNMLRIIPSNTAFTHRITVPAWARIVWMRFINNDVTTARENNILHRWNTDAAGAALTQWDSHFWSDDQLYPIRLGPFGHPMYDYNGQTSVNHVWHPIFVPAGGGTLHGRFGSEFNGPDGWCSGLAFTDNPQGWSYANAITLTRSGDRPYSISNYNTPGIPDPVAMTWAGGSQGLSRVTISQGNGFTIANSTGSYVPITNNGLGKRITLVLDNDDGFDPSYETHIALGATEKGGEFAHQPVDWLTLAVANTQEVFRTVSYDFTAAEVAAATVNGTLDQALVRFWATHNFDNSMQIAQFHMYDI